MSKRRLKFSKLNMAKYISHLDLLRCFTRSIMRSELPVEYSQGFNPHQKMTFALPLPVGVTSECEFVDISFAGEETTDAEIMEKLNLNLPPDIKILSVGDINNKASDIVCAEYIVKLQADKKFDALAVVNFFNQSEVIVMKRTKKKVDKPINLMEYIKAFELLEDKGNTLTLRLVLDAGGERSIKPDMVIKALCKELSDVSPDMADIHRKQVFCRKNDVLEVFI